MSDISRASWNKVVLNVVSVLTRNKIRYHIDASSSLYMQGLDFPMDDLDVTVEWGSIGKVVSLFTGYKPTLVSDGYPPSSRFFICNCPVHVMSYKSESGIGEAGDRVTVEIDKTIIWCKSIEFYQKHMKPDHVLRGPLREFMQRKMKP